MSNHINILNDVSSPKASSIYPTHEKITNFYQNHLGDMLTKHSKVFQTRLDLHLPLKGVKESQKQIRDFTENLTRDLKRNYP